MGITTLLEVGCKTIANMVRGKSSSEVRQIFNISYDSPGEGLSAPNDNEDASQVVPATQDAAAGCDTPMLVN